MQTTDTVYANPMFADLDIGSVMRVGHPDIADGDRHIVEVVRAFRDQRGAPLTVLDVGSGSGDLSVLLAEALEDCRVVACEIEPVPLEQARRKLAATAGGAVFGRPFAAWAEPVDVLISWGTHHHLGHDYLEHVRSVLAPGGLLVIGDEFCPEYLTDADRDRLARAATLSLVDGYLFDDPADVEAYRTTGAVPEWSARLEDARRRALWRWYRYVCDFALEQGAWSVLVTELQIARDDLVTSFAGEHKTSPYLLERELELEGFEILSRERIGDREPELTSFAVYTARPRGAA